MVELYQPHLNKIFIFLDPTKPQPEPEGNTLTSVTISQQGYLNQVYSPTNLDEFRPGDVITLDYRDTYIFVFIGVYTPGQPSCAYVTCAMNQSTSRITGTNNTNFTLLYKKMPYYNQSTECTLQLGNGLNIFCARYNIQGYNNSFTVSSMIQFEDPSTFNTNNRLIVTPVTSWTGY